MNNADKFQLDEDMAVLEQTTQLLQAKGEKAELHHTGGGIYCIYVPVQSDEWTYWGTADEVWGCDIYKGEELLDSAYLENAPVSLNAVPQAAEAIVSYLNSRRMGNEAQSLLM
jgi:hypothetical protein